MVTGVRNLSVRAEVGAPRQRERRSPAGRTGGGKTWAPGSPLGRRQEAPGLEDPASRAGGGFLLLNGQDLGRPRGTQPPSRRADKDFESGQGLGASGISAVQPPGGRGPGGRLQMKRPHSGRALNEGL